MTSPCPVLAVVDVGVSLRSARMPRADYEGWMASAYDAGRSLGPAVFDAWARVVKPFLVALGGRPVLDLGAGTGRFSGHLAEWSGAAVIAVEPAAAMVRRAKAKGMAGVDVVVGAGEAIPLRDRTVAAVWLSQVVHHIDDLDKAAVELGRVVQPGGCLLIRGEFGKVGASRSGLAVYRYFPAAGRVADTFPSRRRVLEVFGSAGFVEETSTTVAQVTAASLRALHGRLSTRADSTLAALDDDTFTAGLEALDRDARSETSPTPVVDHLPFTVLRSASTTDPH
jgi:ubiquinone/menaquinone biosynthesis C-methylase UbiE